MTQVTVIGILLAAGSAGESPQPTVSAAPIARTTSMASRRPSSPVERSAGCIFGSMPALGQENFVYNQGVNVEEYVDVAVNVFFDIHTLIVDEVFLSQSWHTAEYASGRALNRGARPPRSHGGRPGDWCGANGWLWRFTGRTGR